MADLPIVCTLDAATRQTRREGLLAQLAASALKREPLANGLRLEFAAAAGTLALIARVVDAERLCCRFLQFQLTVPPDERPVSLELTGPPGTREFLEALLAPSS